MNPPEAVYSTLASATELKTWYLYTCISVKLYITLRDIEVQTQSENIYRLGANYGFQVLYVLEQFTIAGERVARGSHNLRNETLVWDFLPRETGRWSFWHRSGANPSLAPVQLHLEYILPWHYFKWMQILHRFLPVRMTFSFIFSSRFFTAWRAQAKS